MKAVLCFLGVSSLLLTAYACTLPGSNRGNVITFSQADIQSIVDAHNKEKINTPSATKGGKLYTWSTDLQNNAATWARRCNFQHTSQACRSNIGGFSYAGENLATGSKGAYDGMPGVLKMIQSWIDEKKDYSWPTKACNGMCGHYTQVVWGATTAVGCANVACPSGTVLGSFEAYYLVCQYGPGGNYQGQDPSAVASSGACAGRPCGVGGLCTETGSTFDCSCMNGFSKSGNKCVAGGSGSTPPAGGSTPPAGGTTPPTDPCAGGDKCSGQGVCSNSGGVAKCSCNAGYTGANCATVVNPCASNPCGAHGTCAAASGSFKCTCRDNYSGQYCTTAPVSTSTSTVPAQTPIVTEVFKGLVSRSGNRFSAQNAALQTQALAAAKSCGNEYSASSATMLLCGMETLGASDAAFYKDMIIDMWASYSQFWTVANSMGCVLDTKTDCGACDYGRNRALVCAYGQPAEINTFVDHPMAWGLVSKNGDRAMFTRPKSHQLTAIIGCSAFVVAAALVITAIVVRRRRVAAEYVRMTTEMVVV